jgi:hypothetical protein
MKVLVECKMKTLKEVMDEKWNTDLWPKALSHDVGEVPGALLSSFWLAMVHEILFGLLEQVVRRDN